MTETRVLTRSVIEEYKNESHSLTTELVKIYECPSDAKASIILMIHTSNIDNINDGSVTVCWSDYTQEDRLTYFINDGNLPARSGLNVIHGKHILEPLDAIWAKADALNRIHITMSILEVS